VGIVGFATAAIVAFIADESALATVALALAILAFVCQLVIFAIQTTNSNAQLAQARDLNAHTETLVQTMLTRLESTHEMIKHQAETFNEVARLKSTSSDVLAMPPEVPTAGRDRISAVNRAMGIEPGDDRRAVVAWPATRDEIENAVTVLEARDDIEVSVFGLNVLALLRSEIGSMSGDLVYTDVTDGWALSEGYLKEMTPSEGARQVRVTEAGRAVGSVLCAPWPPPEYASDLADRLWALRQRLEVEVAEGFARTVA
jgi:hypothetical protein